MTGRTGWALWAALLAQGCDFGAPAVAPEAPSDAADRVTEAAAAAPRPKAVHDVYTHEYRIEAPDVLRLGWNTFRFANRGNQAHFVYLYRIADGKTIEDQLAEVVKPFDDMLAGLQDGSLSKADLSPFLEARVPAWGLQMVPSGGAGLVSPGGSTTASFRLDTPGTYLLECYVKSPDGKWHTSMGMLHQIQVLDEPGGGVEPVADVVVDLDDSGVAAPEVLAVGPHTVRVNINATPAAFMPYDLHLARLSDQSVLEDIVFWMDWSNVGGLRAPAPAEFLGGLENMRAGGYGYVEIDLTPGRYLWISETFAETMHRGFTVQ